MKNLYTTILLAGSALVATSQITLTKSNIPVPTGTVPLQNITAQITTALTIGNNQTWDYSTLSQGTVSSNPYVTVNNNSNFPAAQFMLDQYFKNLTPALGYYYDQYYEITDSGAAVVGIYVPEQKFGLGALTGNTNDTLHILENYSYNPNTTWRLLAFPATVGSSWQGIERHTVNMELTVASAGLNKAPLQQVFYMNRKDSVVGWGTLKLPAQTGFNSNVPVLQNKTQQYFIDSFYLSGSPAPQQITNAFGITQGQKTGLSNRLAFYREGAFNYQMIVAFTDSTLSTPNLAFISTELPPLVSGIDDVNSKVTSTIYPNPVSGNNFTISLNEEVQDATISIYDITGRAVEKTTPAIHGTTLHITLNTTLTNGMYLYTINTTTGKQITAGRFTTTK